MKNKILMIISLTFLVSTFIIATNISFFKQDVVEQKSKAVNENTMVLDKDNFIYTKEELNKIKSLDGIKSIDYIQNEYTPAIILNQEGKDEYIFLNSESVPLNEFQNDYKDLEYIAGGKIKSKNGIVISDIYAQEMLKLDEYKKYKNIDGLIGKTISEKDDITLDDFTIDGVYKSNPMIDKKSEYVMYSDTLYKDIGFNAPQIYTNQKPKNLYSIEGYITEYNSSQVYSPENMEILEANNFVEPGEEDEEGFVKLDYNIAVKQGYKGMIDPSNAEEVYGDDIVSRIFISFEDKDSYDKALKELSSGSLKAIGNQSRITTKDNYKSFLMNDLNFKPKDSYKNFVVLFTAILVLLYLKFFKGNFKNVIIDYVLAAIIAYTLAIIIAVVMNVTPFYTQSIAITMIPLVILLIIGMIYNKVRYKN